MSDSVWRISCDGWRLGFRALRTTPRLFVTALLIEILAGYGESFLVFELFPGATIGTKLRIATIPSIIVTAAVLSSVLMGVHRFVILGETADMPVWRMRPSYGRFFRWFLFMKILWELPSFVSYLIGANHRPASQVLRVILFVVTQIISVRLVLMFPAIATGSAFSQWRDVWQFSRGHGWKIFFATILTTMATVLLTTAIMLNARATAFATVGGVLRTILNLISWYLLAAIASRLFMVLSPPPSAPSA